MIVPIAICNINSYLYDGIQSFDAEGIEIRLRMKSEPVLHVSKWFPGGKQSLYAPILIVFLRTELAPFAAIAPLQRDMHAARWTPARNIQDVRRDSAHSASHFLSRSCVICLCCSSASRSSVASSFSSRRSRIASISSADFPVAQTI